MKMNWITIFYYRTLYNLQLAYRKRRLDRIEKKYYKAFPDRVNDHFIATRPIPIPPVKKYHAVTLKSEVMLPKEAVTSLGNNVKNIVKSETLRRLEPEIAKRVEIHTVFYPERDFVTYEGYFRFYEED